MRQWAEVEGEPEAAPPPPPFAHRKTEIRNSFNNLMDYIWKLPGFLESEREIEREKLLDYFPESTDPEIAARNAELRDLRSAIEFTKIDVAFRRYMTTSSLIMVVSQYEYHLLRIAHELQEWGLWREPARPRQGMAGHIAGIAAVAGKSWPPESYSEMRHAVMFRNCLAHAGGVLWMSRDTDEIRRIVKTRAFYPPELRDKSPEFHPENDPRLGFSSVGQVLHVPLLYSHWLCARARDCLTEICDMVNPVPTLPFPGGL